MKTSKNLFNIVFLLFATLCFSGCVITVSPSQEEIFNKQQARKIFEDNFFNKRWANDSSYKITNGNTTLYVRDIIYLENQQLIQLVKFSTKSDMSNIISSYKITYNYEPVLKNGNYKITMNLDPTGYNFEKGTQDNLTRSYILNMIKKSKDTTFDFISTPQEMKIFNFNKFSLQIEYERYIPSKNSF